MDYNTNVACGTAEMAARSEHHAAMLMLEQRSAQLQKLIDVLTQRLDPALRPVGPSNDAMEKAPESSVQIIAHVDSVSRVVDKCIQRVESLNDRLVI